MAVPCGASFSDIVESIAVGGVMRRKYLSRHFSVTIRGTSSGGSSTYLIGCDGAAGQNCVNYRGTRQGEEWQRGW